MLPPFATPNDYATNYGTVAARTDMDLFAASQLIRQFAGWQVWPQTTDTWIVDGPGTDVLMLPTKNLVALTALSETLPGAGQQPVALDVTQLEWSATGMVWRTINLDYWRNMWTSRARGITVTATHGFPEVPMDIARLTLDLARRAALNPAGALVMTRVGTRLESYGKAQTTGLLKEEQEILQPYWLAI
jgi:hypothetical protein